MWAVVWVLWGGTCLGGLLHGQAAAGEVVAVVELPSAACRAGCWLDGVRVRWHGGGCELQLLCNILMMSGLMSAAGGAHVLVMHQLCSCVGAAASPRGLCSAARQPILVPASRCNPGHLHVDACMTSARQLWEAHLQRFAVGRALNGQLLKDAAVVGCCCLTRVSARLQGHAPRQHAWVQ